MKFVDKKIWDIVSEYKAGRRFTAQTVVESMIKIKFKFTPNCTKISMVLNKCPMVVPLNTRSPITFERLDLVFKPTSGWRVEGDGEE